MTVCVAVAQGNVKVNKVKKGGTLYVYVRLQKAAPLLAGQLALRLHGLKLKNPEGMFKKSDLLRVVPEDVNKS